jgi:hypothetical protein
MSFMGVTVTTGGVSVSALQTEAEAEAAAG